MALGRPRQLRPPNPAKRGVPAPNPRREPARGGVGAPRPPGESPRGSGRMKPSLWSWMLAARTAPVAINVSRCWKPSLMRLLTIPWPAPMASLPWKVWGSALRHKPTSYTILESPCLLLVYGACLKLVYGANPNRREERCLKFLEGRFPISLLCGMVSASVGPTGWRTSCSSVFFLPMACDRIVVHSCEKVTECGVWREQDSCGSYLVSLSLYLSLACYKSIQVTTLSLMPGQVPECLICPPLVSAARVLRDVAPGGAQEVITAFTMSNCSNSIYRHVRCSRNRIVDLQNVFSMVGDNSL